MSERLTPVELMTKLISFPTVSRDTNIPLIDWVADYLDSHGIESHRYICLLYTSPSPRDS